MRAALCWLPLALLLVAAACPVLAQGDNSLDAVDLNYHVDRLVEYSWRDEVSRELGTQAHETVALAAAHEEETGVDDPRVQRRRLLDGAADCLHRMVSLFANLSVDHKPLLPLDGVDIGLIVAVIFTLLLAAGGGVGGGAVFVPLYILLGGFPTGTAVALSNVTVLGGAAANLLVNSTRRHPKLQRPLIDWDLILVMEPTTILGALAGGYLNKFLPVWFVSVLLAVLLTAISWKLVLKVADTYRAESELLKEITREITRSGGSRLSAAALEAAAPELRRPLLSPEGTAAEEDAAGGGAVPSAAAAAARDGGGAVAVPGVSKDIVAGGVGGGATDSPRFFGVGTPSSEVQALLGRALRKTSSYAVADWTPDVVGAHEADVLDELRQENDGGTAAQDAAQRAAVAALLPAGSDTAVELERILQREARQLPTGKLVLLAVLMAAVVASDTYKTTVTCGSAQYWGIVLSVVPVAAAVTLGVRQRLLVKAATKAAEGVVPIPGDVHWTPRNTLVYPTLCTAAGVIAGLFGVGGGIVKAPLMLEMGVLPEVAAATSGTMIFMTAFSACLVYSHLGVLMADYALVLGSLGFVATLLGQLATIAVLRAVGRRSIIIGLMAALMVVATGVSYVQSIANTVHTVQSGEGLWDWGSVCSGEGGGEGIV